MKRKVLIAVVGTLFLVFGGSLAGLCGEADDVSSSLLYGTSVETYIQKCEAKAKFLNSGSLNIRMSAMRSTVKGAFIQANRTAMIEYLMEKNVPFNAHRIEYHLTRKYSESVHPQEIYAVLLKEHSYQ